METPSTVTSTPDPTVVNPTSVASGVNPAQTTAQQIVDTSALIAQYEQRIRALMSEKDKAINERNQAIAQLTELQSTHTSFQEQTQSSLTAAANSAQQAIDRATHLEHEIAQERAKNSKLSALMQRPHLAPYEKLIPEEADTDKLKHILDELEQIRQEDLNKHLPAPHQSPASAPPGSPSSTPASLLQTLYGNRANMNPALMQQQPPIPASSPAQMNPAAVSSDDVVAAINQLYAEARQIGTQEAFANATKRAALLAQSTPR